MYFQLAKCLVLGHGKLTLSKLTYLSNKYSEHCRLFICWIWHIIVQCSLIEQTTVRLVFVLVWRRIHIEPLKIRRINILQGSWWLHIIIIKGLLYIMILSSKLTKMDGIRQELKTRDDWIVPIVNLYRVCLFTLFLSVNSHS